MTRRNFVAHRISAGFNDNVGFDKVGLASRDIS